MSLSGNMTGNAAANESIDLNDTLFSILIKASLISASMIRSCSNMDVIDTCFFCELSSATCVDVSSCFDVDADDELSLASKKVLMELPKLDAFELVEELDAPKLVDEDG